MPPHYQRDQSLLRETVIELDYFFDHHAGSQMEPLARKLEAGAAAAQQEQELIADERHGSGDVGADHGRPVRSLIPGQEVAGQTEPHGQVEDGEPCQPGELTATFVTGHKEHREHVQQQGNHDDVGADGMEHTEEPAIGHIIHNGLNTGEGLFRIRHIEHKEQDAGNNLNFEEYQEHRAKGVPGIDFPRQQIAMQFLVVKIFDAETSINEIDQHFYRLHKFPLSDFELVAIKLDN